MAEEQFLECPTCDDLVEHRVLRATPNTVTVQCTECQAVRSMPPPRDRAVSVSLVVSHGETSTRDRLEVPPDEEVRVADEFEHDGHRMLVTAIELRGGRPVKKAEAGEIGTLFCKVFDTVELKLSVNERDRTESLTETVLPEEEIHVGEVREVQGRRLVVKTLKSDRNRTIRKGYLFARNVVRAFCDPAPRGAEPGDRLDFEDLPSRAGRPPKPAKGGPRKTHTGGAGRRR